MPDPSRRISTVLAAVATTLVASAPPAFAGAGNSTAQPVIATRGKAVLTVDGRQFKDADGNGRLDPYEDWRLDAEARARDLVSKMTLDEKAGMMLIDSLSPDFGGVVPDLANDYVRNQRMTRFILRSVVTGSPVRSTGPGFGGQPVTPEQAATFTNAVQETGGGDAPGHSGALQVERAQSLRAQARLGHQRGRGRVLGVAEGGRPGRHARHGADPEFARDDGRRSGGPSACGGCTATWPTCRPSRAGTACTRPSPKTRTSCADIMKVLVRGTCRAGRGHAGDQRRAHHQALPGRRPAGVGPRSALHVRQDPGLSGRPVRLPPEAVQGRDRCRRRRRSCRTTACPIGRALRRSSTSTRTGIAFSKPVVDRPAARTARLQGLRQLRHRRSSRDARGASRQDRSRARRGRDQRGIDVLSGFHQKQTIVDLVEERARQRGAGERGGDASAEGAVPARPVREPVRRRRGGRGHRRQARVPGERALDAQRRSVVLLKNRPGDRGRGKVLPLTAPSAGAGDASTRWVSTPPWRAGRNTAVIRS